MILKWRDRGWPCFLLRTHETFANLNRSHLIAFKVRFEDLGYRRFEWKCDALNAPSREAAERFGFSFEGIFRQAVVTRGRNRDTAWYSIIDGEYPSLRPAYDMWLDERNFDNQGRQIRRLGELMERG